MKMIDEQIKDLQKQISELYEKKAKMENTGASKYIDKFLKLDTGFEFYLVKVDYAEYQAGFGIILKGDFVGIEHGMIERVNSGEFCLDDFNSITEIDNIDQEIIKYIQEEGFFEDK